MKRTLLEKKISNIFNGTVFLLVALIIITCGCKSSKRSSSPPPPAVYTVNTTVNPVGMSANDYIEMFFNDPGNPLLYLVVPEYVYFQGLVYSKGHIKTMGPMRVMGGVFCTKDDAGAEKQVSLESGAMLTTIPEYQQQRLIPPKNRFRVVNWAEVGAEPTRGKAVP